MTELSPFVYWGQTKTKVSLKVELRDVENPHIQIEEDSLNFSAVAVGVGGHNKYTFRTEFYHPVDPKGCKYKITDHSVEIELQKSGSGEIWPRLTERSARLPWLKANFDKFEYEDISEEEQEQDYQITQNIIDQRIKRSGLEDEPGLNLRMPSLKQCYLALYNLCQWAGYSGIVLVIVVRFIRDGTDSIPGTYDAVGGNLMICQLLACLEFIHPMLGLVKSSWLPPFAQVLGRNIVLFMVVAQDKRMQVHTLVFYLFTIWSSVEVFRYPFYFLSCLGTESKLITLLRYTVWIPLYPAGGLCEALIIYVGRSYYQETGIWSVSLPNKWNISFNFPTFLVIYLPLLAMGLTFMLKHMYVQTQKKLGAKRKTKTR